jgi:hypothetical protein
LNIADDWNFFFSYATHAAANSRLIGLSQYCATLRDPDRRKEKLFINAKEQV